MQFIYFSYMTGCEYHCEENLYLDGLVHKRPNSNANALEFNPSCTNPSI